MKKLLLAFGFIIVSSIIFFGKDIQLSASATNNVLDVAVKRLTAGEIAGFNSSWGSASPIQSGDYAVSLTIENNTGFAATGYLIYYDSTICSPVFYQPNPNASVRLAFKKGIAGEDLGFTYEHNASDSLLGFASFGSYDSTEDGIIFTFFLRPYNSLLPADEESLITYHEADRWLDTASNPVTHTVTNGFTLYQSAASNLYGSWLIGDMNNDGDISVDDALLIQGLYTYCGTGSSISDTDYIATYTLYSTDYDAAFVISVCDINQDGVIDNSDVSLVLSYYTTYVLGHGDLNNYTGNIGSAAEVFFEVFVPFT